MIQHQNKLFKEKDLQLLMFEQRIKYNDNNKITFSVVTIVSIFFRSKLLWNVYPTCDNTQKNKNILKLK